MSKRATPTLPAGLLSCARLLHCCWHHSLTTTAEELGLPKQIKACLGLARQALPDQEWTHLFWFRLIFLCQRRQIFVGANIRPPLHILPKAPCPALCVPPPGTRGIRATARPVPQDSALVWWPASYFTAYGWRLFIFIRECTLCTMSGLIGAVNTAGRCACSAGPPSAPCTDTIGLEAPILQNIICPSFARQTARWAATKPFEAAEQRRQRKRPCMQAMAISSVPGGRRPHGVSSLFQLAILAGK